MSELRAAVAKAVGVDPEEVMSFGEYSDGWLVLTRHGERFENVVLAHDDEGTPVRALDLSEQILDLLQGAGYQTVEQVRDATDSDLRAVKGIGPASLQDIRKALA